MPDYEAFLEAYFEEAPRGQKGRDPAKRFASALRRDGFLPSYHFPQQFLRRVLALGHRFDPDTFRDEFFNARHYRQTRRGYNTRIAVVRDVPVVYRMGGFTGNNPVLITVLDPGPLPPVKGIQAPPAARESDFWLEDGDEAGKQHGSDYRREQQAFLKSHIKINPNQPRFITGWIKQEDKRRARAAQRRKPGWTAAGKTATARKFAQMRAILADPKQSVAAKKWARRQLQRLGAGQKRLKLLQSGQRLDKPDYRTVPGFDTGHPIPHQPGVHDRNTFRVENARSNRGRPAKAKKLLEPRIGTRWKHYAESDFELEDL